MKVKDILEKARPQWIPNANYDEVNPVVSVLLPTYKRAESGHFERAVRSVLAQSFSELELIIVDDCSTDGTFDIIQRIMKTDSRLSCIRHTKNIGLPAISEFEAYQKARGTYIAFIFDDNEWEWDAIEQLVEYAQTNKIKALAGQYMLFCGKPGASYNEPANWSVLGGSHVNLSNLMITNSFANGAVLLHRDTIETVGFLDPNVSLSRLWDWDLWQRIARTFRFEMVDIMVGREKGVGLEDSLGNTHQLYQWAAQERMHQPRNQELLVETYLECDVFDVTLPSSPFLYRSNCWIAKQYEKKIWYNPNDVSLLSIKQKSELPWKGKRIAFLNASMQVNASATINWGRLPYSEDYVMFYSSLYYFDYFNWILADAIVIERDLSASVDVVLRWAKAMGIACYYYIDDNFTVLAKDYAKTELSENMRSLAKETTAEHINEFDGIFSSTETLKEFFIQEGVYKNISIMEPIFDPIYIQPYHELSETVNIAFFGSFIRGEVLREIVLPALIRISEMYNICLYCPDETFKAIVSSFENIKIKDSQISIAINTNFWIHAFPRTLSLELALQRLADKNIQIQLHCGPNIRNNRYKTANALLNATCLGAVLVATDDDPYSNIQSDKPVCLLAENTIDAWEIAIRKILNKEVHKEIYHNALNYCKEKYDVVLGVNSVIETMKKVTPYEMIDLNKRLLSYSQYLNSIIGGSSHVITSVSSMPASHGLIPALMFLSTLTSRKLTQAIKMTVPGWRKGSKRLLRLLPLSLSAPIAYGQYAESRIPNVSDAIKIVMIPSAPTSVLFEFVANNKIVNQKIVQIDMMRVVSLKMPKVSGSIRLRVANHSENGLLYVLQRGILSHGIFEVEIDKKGETTIV